jgi:hypothetical protein
VLIVLVESDWHEVPEELKDLEEENVWSCVLSYSVALR